VTVVADFTEDERNLLVRLPRWIVAAASAAQHDNAARTHAEVEAGFIAVANGRQNTNPLVVEIANLTMGVFDDKRSTAAEGGLDGALAQAAAAWQLLRTKAHAAEASAYGRWLLDITDDVISAARSDDVLGFGGTMVTPAEQAFRDRLAQILV
jgi:hypothetical protein